MKEQLLLMGNEAIAAGIVQSGCAVVTGYPGTPSSEVLPAVVQFSRGKAAAPHVQWAVNEKVAFEVAYAAAISGIRAAVVMKQVGLNVASDPLMSAAYMGTRGGFVVVSADDPGPHSSQTEQDSRLMAVMARVPVLDPDSPAQALELTRTAFELSERFQTPVILRPTTRVCHARQDIAISWNVAEPGRPAFEKNPGRWAATPKFRFQLHQELEKKLTDLAAWDETAPRLLNEGVSGPIAVVTSGVAAAHTREIVKDLGLWRRLPLYQVVQPYPLHPAFVDLLRSRYERVLVIEETVGVMEMQIAGAVPVLGKGSGTVGRVGELTPEAIETVIREVSGIGGEAATLLPQPGKRPTLCAGCPHRASFFAIKKAAPKGIFPSDIGCYTLGLNLGAVDTVLCMGAAVSQAQGFFHAFGHEDKAPPIVATIGDSTFFHSGIPPLVDAVVQGAGIVLVILDNHTTAMTGSQPTAASGVGASGEALGKVDMEALVRACGVTFCRTLDPYDIPAMTAQIKQALSHAREKKGPAVIISRHPCLLDKRMSGFKAPVIPMTVTEACDGCGYCLTHFECPALVAVEGEERVRIDDMLCVQCGNCRYVCPKKAIQPVGQTVKEE